ncbi:hypothetical protein [Vagococcus zengguangii]|uniref:Uncharacterized protein n=1 Tax=Vagococcus zengguangii TaxID=2571750 RepID=A0A4D7CV26_9ENTE|nr:hypothetical protein [Vagococcus zengguangii]QCI87194.1 hypothetical protein FA707_09750 [Vagococcus zengguangii]TLG80698.1 hypothetical protein FE258_04365 [Vagococcus zengguangii]
MDFHMKLPRNAKEGILFTLIIAFLSVNLIAPIISMLEAGFTMDTYTTILKKIPFIFITVLVVVSLLHPLGSKLAQKIVGENDSFNSKIIIDTLCTVFFMSMVMTVIGSWFGMGEISLAPFKTYFQKWPRNFGVAFAIELLVAQPIARAVMNAMHKKQDAKLAK